MEHLRSGPTTSESTSPDAVAPGGLLTYHLTHTHSGDDATQVVTDTVPALPPIITATGPGVIQVSSQAITWMISVSASLQVTLTIQAKVALMPGTAINTTMFSSTQMLTRQVSIMAYSSRVFLPLVLENERVDPRATAGSRHKEHPKPRKRKTTEV